MPDGNIEMERRLNQTALLWKTTPPEGNEDFLESLRQQVFTLSFELFDDKDSSMAFMDAFEEAYQNYEANQGAFSNYLSYLLKRRKIDHARYDSRHAPRGDSLDAPLSPSEDNGPTLGSMLPSAEANPENRVLFESSYVELTALVLNYAQNHTGRQANEARRRWYRIFFTEDMTLTYKTSSYRFHHERDIFKAMLLPYLDYYMSRPCRTGKEIADAPLKPYGEVVPAQEGSQAEVSVPLPADVSLAYLALCEGVSATRAARSNQLKSYRDEVKPMSAR